eukprot:gene21567-18804_t
MSLARHVTEALAQYDISAAKRALDSGEQLPVELQDAYEMLIHNLTIVLHGHIVELVSAPSSHDRREPQRIQQRQLR